MNLIRLCLTHSRNALFLSVFAGVLSGACNAGLLAIMNAVLNAHGSGPTFAIRYFIALCMSLPLLRIVSEVLLSRLSQYALYTMRMDICRQILAIPLNELEMIGPARLLAVLTDDLPSITATIMAIPILCINSAVVVGCLIYMGALSRMLLAITLGSITAGIIGFEALTHRARRFFHLARLDSDLLHEQFRCVIHGVKELKLHRARGHEFIEAVLERASRSFRDHNIKGMTVYSAASGWAQVLIFAVVGIVIFALPEMHRFDYSTLTAYTLALLYLMAPLQVIVTVSPAVGRCGVALDNVRDLGFVLNASTIKETERKQDLCSWDSLHLASITHTYFHDEEKCEFKLGPIDLIFLPGELVFLAGGNGAGKTTLAKLLVGLYTPEQGVIYLNGRPIDTASAREHYRQHFSAVFADPFIFNRLLGLPPERLKKHLKAYLDQLRLSTKVQISEDGTLSTVDLSQGQRKRLALLAAYLEDRPVYLFDEWAADQDPLFKDVFYRQLLPELKSRGKTIFVISHDEHYYWVADRVIRLENGAVISEMKKCDFSDEVKPSVT